MLLVGSILGLYLYSAHKEVEAREGERLATQAKVIDQNLAHQLLATNSALDSILRSLPFLRSQKGGQALVRHRLQSVKDAIPGVRTLLILNAEGTAIASDKEELVGRSFRERDYFKVARQDHDPAMLHVSPPFKTVLGVFAMNVVKMIPNERGEFAGVISATLDPEYFSTLLESVRYSPDMWTSLAHADGMLFMMVPQRPGIEGISLDKPGSFRNRHLESGETATVMSGIVAATGEERMMAQRTIKPNGLAMDKSLGLAVARDLSSIFAPWRKEVLVLGSLFGVFVLVATVGLYFLQHKQRAYSTLLTARETERKQSEEMLRESYDSLRNTLQTTLDGFWRVDSQCILVAVNKAYRLQSGYTREELLGMHISKLEANETPAEIAERRQRIIGTGADQFLSKHRRKDGSIWDVEVSVTYSPTAGGHFFVFLRDITQRIQDEARRADAERALRNSEERMRAFFDNVPVGIFISDRAGKFIYVNPAMPRILGYDSSEELITLVNRTSIAEALYVDPKRREVIIQELESSHKRWYSVENQYRRKDGEIIDAILAFGEQTDAATGEPQYYGVVTDITERKQLEQALTQRKAELQDLYRTLQTLREEERARFARELHDGTGHLLTAMLMDLAWVDAKLPKDGSPVSSKLASAVTLSEQVVDSIRDVMEDLRPSILDELGLATALEGFVANFATRTGIRCDLVTSGEEAKLGNELATDIFRIVQEALNNVQKYAQATRVLVRLEQSNDEITLVVEDNGVGLPETTAGGRQGFGVRGMNERVSILNGRFSITSLPGKGVRIEVVIPT